MMRNWRAWGPWSRCCRSIPLADGVRTRAEGLFVLGFPPGSRPDIGVLRGRFRMLATIHHPDSGYGSHDRMSQLNSAMDILQR